MLKWLIYRYNRYVQNWEEWGIDDFKNGKFSVIVGNSTYFFNECTETFGDNYPIREHCNRTGDPSNGCLTTRAFHYRAKIPYPNADEVTVRIVNRESGTLIYNSTYQLRKDEAKTWDMMDCDSAESCVALCESWGGLSIADLKACSYSAYLGNLCYRVRPADGYEEVDYQIDHPPSYDLNNYFGGVGCK